MFTWVLLRLVALVLSTTTTVTLGQALPTSTCSNGLCFAILAPTASEMGATIALKGSPEALASLNREGGWEVWNCSPDGTNQTVSIACANPSGCDDLYKGGAVGTIVKLDKKCTNSEFGVIVAEDRAEDQSLPHAVAKRLVKRGIETPDVRNVTLRELSEVDGRHGNVSFYVFGSTWGQGLDVPHPHDTREVSWKRDFADIWETFKGIFGIIVTSGVGPLALLPTPWSVDGHHKFPVQVNQTVELFDKNLFCQKYARARIGVTAKVHVTGAIDVGVVAAGTVFPPTLTTFKMFTDVTADVEARLRLALSVEGTIASGDIPMFEIGVPGLNVPGIINVGPAFKIVASASGTLALDMDLDVALRYRLAHWTSTFPSPDPLSPDLIPQDTDHPMSLAISEHVEAYASVEAHLTPKLEVSINVFNGVGKVAVYLGLDVWGRARANVKHQGRLVHEFQNTTKPEPPKPVSITGRRLHSLPSPKTDGSVESAGSPVQKFQNKQLAERETWADTNNTVCATVLMGLNAHIMAEGKLFTIFEHYSKLVLWRRDWIVYRKCAEEDYLSVPLPLPAGGGGSSPEPEKCEPGFEYDPTTGSCKPRDMEIGAWRREVAVPDRMPLPIECPKAGPVGAVSQLFKESFKPLAAVVIPNAKP